MNRTTYIYALLDPRTNEVRYVGKANNPAQRLGQHLAPCKRERQTYKNRWITGLLNNGLRPLLIVLEQTSDVSWKEAEKLWISRYRDIGARLTNTTDGGEGHSGETFSLETRAKISANSRSRVVSEETKKKHRERARQRHTEDAKEKMRVAALRRIQEQGTDHIAELGKKNLGRKRSNSRSSYIGVTTTGYPNNKFKATIRVDGTRTYLGSFRTEEEAARAYDAAALNHHGPGVKINFPESMS